MTRINLLPWREAYRREKNRDFFITMALFMGISAAIGLGGLKFADDKVQFQVKRNQLLENELALLQEELKEIAELEQTKNNLLARMEIIQQLQGQRPQIVHTFYEIAIRVPDGVFLTAMKQSGEKLLVLEGRAESNARVSALMRQLDRSDYFADPRLEVIQADRDNGISTFKLSLVQVLPVADTESEYGI